MIKEQKQVEDFHKAFDLEISDKPTALSDELILLRIKLIEEEFSELSSALWDDDLVEVADAIADLLYVVYGTAVTCGIDMEPIFEEVHKSNMAKVGGYKREDGKYMKPEGWQPPNLCPLIKAQLGEV